MPPEQLIAVPPRLTYSSCVRSEGLSSSVVVPPAAPGSYVVVEAGRRHLVRRIRVGLVVAHQVGPLRRAAKLPMPSCRLGTSPSPDFIGSPSRDRIR